MIAVRSAGVGDVVDGDAGLADLLLQLLAEPAGAAEQVAGGEDAHVPHRHALTGVGERAEHRLGPEVDGVLVGVLAELGHVDAEDPDVVAHRVLLLRSPVTPAGVGRSLAGVRSAPSAPVIRSQLLLGS
jgi:hypothetical protein